MKKRKRVSIISRESDSRTLDIAMLEAELLSRGVDVRVLSKLFTKDRSLKALGYMGHVLKQEAAILASDVVVLDTYCIPASMIPHRRGTKVVQMWHALGAVKKFGWQTVGREGGSSERVAKLMKMHRRYDYVVCPSSKTAGYFCEAFDTASGKIVKYGLPRIDYIKSVAAGSRREDMQKKILAAYPQLTSTETILYAPTFRRGKAVDVQSLVDAIEQRAPGKYNIVVKLHPLYRGSKADEPEEDACDGAVTGTAETTAATGAAAAHQATRSSVIYDEIFSSYDWLSVADIVISDYSSFVIESTLADKPLFIYAYDIDEYEVNTGLNMDFAAEPIAPYVFREAGELAQALDSASGYDTGVIYDLNGAATPKGGDKACRHSAGYDFDALHAFRDRYIDIETGGGHTENYCTSALADFIEAL